MGMASRSYGPRFRWNGGGAVPPALKNILIATTAVFVAQTIIEMQFGVVGQTWYLKWFGLIPAGVAPGLRFWQPFTYLFLHGGLWHLLMNMFILWMFGRDLEPIWGKKKFYSYYFACGAGAGLINVAASWIYARMGHPGSTVTVTIGASGAVFGVLIACAVLFPHRQVWLIPFPVALSMRVFVAIMAAIEFYGELTAGGDGVSHISHLGGMAIGYFYLRRGSFFSSTRNTFSDWKRKRLRRKFEVYARTRKNDPPPRPDRWVN